MTTSALPVFRLARFLFRLTAGLLLALAAGHAMAGSYPERPGGKDHPLVSRFQGSVLYNYGTIAFDRVEVPAADGKKDVVEGRVSNYFYVAPKDRGDYEVWRSYRAALEGAGFRILTACEEAKQCLKEGLGRHAQDWTNRPTTFAGGYSPLSYLSASDNYPPRFLSARLDRPQGNVTVVLTVLPASSSQKDGGAGAPYFVQVIESQPMEAGNVRVDADALGKGLAAEGRVVLPGLFFDTGRAEIKPASKPQLDEMARLLQRDAALKVFIVGHTDNQGGLEANLALSQRRAEAVAAALARDYHIDPKRLGARGVAGYAPLASNASEAGRARNRRVELVAQ